MEWSPPCWDIRSSGLWFELRGCVVSLERKLYSALSLLTQVYERGTADKMLGVIL